MPKRIRRCVIQSILLIVRNQTGTAPLDMTNIKFETINPTSTGTDTRGSPKCFIGVLRNVLKRHNNVNNIGKDFFFMYSQTSFPTSFCLLIVLESNIMIRFFSNLTSVPFLIVCIITAFTGRIVTVFSVKLLLVTIRLSHIS